MQSSSPPASRQGNSFARKLLLPLLLLCGCLVSPSMNAEPRHLEVARSQIGVRETGTNRGPEVEEYLRSVHLGPGYAWCAAFVSWCLDHADVLRPATRTAGARNFLSKSSIRARDVLRGIRSVAPGWLVVWRRGNSWQGHIGFVQEWSGKSGRTIEGNTSGAAGSQRDGDGVYERTRTIQPYNHFRIEAFEPVESIEPVVSDEQVGRPMSRMTSLALRVPKYIYSGFDQPTR